jgi:hypothetical protein
MPDALTLKATKLFRPWLGGRLSIRVELMGTTTLGDLLDDLARTCDDFPALPAHDRAALLAEVLVYDGRRFLSPADEIEPGAVLELLPPTAGG